MFATCPRLAFPVCSNLRVLNSREGEPFGSQLALDSRFAAGNPMLGFCSTCAVHMDLTWAFCALSFSWAFHLRIGSPIQQIFHWSVCLFPRSKLSPTWWLSANSQVCPSPFMFSLVLFCFFSSICCFAFLFFIFIFIFFIFLCLSVLFVRIMSYFSFWLLHLSFLFHTLRTMCDLSLRVGNKHF